jgi:O-antigen/teichoic acid export membrane protein
MTMSGDSVNYLNQRLDQTLMTGLTVRAQLGMYAVAVSIADLSTQVADAARSVAFAEAYAEGNLRLDRLTRSARLLAVLLSCQAIVGGGLALWLLPFILGSSFGGTGPMCALLLVAAVPGGIAYVYTTVLLLLDGQKWALLAEICALSITVPLLVALCPRLGGIGAAIVTICTTLVSTSILVRGVLSKSTLTLKECLIVNAADIRWARAQLPVRLAGGAGSSRPRTPDAK